MRVLVIATVIVVAQWVLIQRYPDPQWVLLILGVPALLLGLTLSGAVGLVSRVARGGGRR
jgi:hypothetical protein